MASALVLVVAAGCHRPPQRPDNGVKRTDLTAPPVKKGGSRVQTAEATERLPRRGPETEPGWVLRERTREVAVGPGLAITPCPQVKGTPTVYTVGSSTMLGLGFVMRKRFKKWGVRLVKGAKSSSGLARPDFFDWPKQIREATRTVDPDVFVVAIGTNDSQAMRRRDRKWVRPSKPEWAEIYARRVDELLKLMNAGRPRTIIWAGPSGLISNYRRRLGGRLNTIMRERIAAFDGQVYFTDLYKIGVKPNGKRAKKFKRPTDGKRLRIRGGDGIHLTLQALHWLLAEPVYRVIRPCWVHVKPGPLPRRAAVVTPERRPRAVTDAPTPRPQRSTKTSPRAAPRETSPSRAPDRRPPD